MLINTLGIISGVAINLSKSMNPPLIRSIKSSPPIISAPAFFASSNFSPTEENQLHHNEANKTKYQYEG